MGIWVSGQRFYVCASFERDDILGTGDEKGYTQGVFDSRFSVDSEKHVQC